MHAENKIGSGQTTALAYAHIQRFLQVLTAMNHRAEPQVQGLESQPICLSVATKIS